MRTALAASASLLLVAGCTDDSGGTDEPSSAASARPSSSSAGPSQTPSAAITPAPVSGPVRFPLKATIPALQRAIAWLTVLLLLLAGCSGADRTETGSPATTASTQETAAPKTSAPTGGSIATSAPIPRGPTRLSVVDQFRAEGREAPGGLRVAGETVPGRWNLSSSRGDVWVAIKVGIDGATSQWWGKGTTPHRTPPSAGDILRGGVVISPDSHWIVWTRTAGDLEDRDPPRVMEVVDTATGNVRWTRAADGDAPELGALAVTNDGVVVFAHCTEPVLDRGGWPQCDAARVDAWAPEVGVTVRVPAGVSAGHGPPGTVTVLRPLVQASGAHNGLLVRQKPSGPTQYVRVSVRGQVDVVATLPSRTSVVTADESYALVDHGCRRRICRWVVVPLDGGERHPLRGVDDASTMRSVDFASFVAERDDLVIVQSRPEVGLPPVLARCSLAQARCVRIKQ